MGTSLKEWTVLSMLEWGTDFFARKNIPDPRLSIEWLLADTLGVKRLDLYLKFNRPLSQKELDHIRPLVKRRAAHEPLQYIIGFTEFMNARIDVTPDVLIPRIETEQLVEIILDHHDSKQQKVLDIGTGSGCIPIALKMERPDWELSAVDISSDALKIAGENADKNNTKILFSRADILAWRELSFEDPFDIIVSNPPYVLPGEKEKLEPQVVEHEPDTALFCKDINRMYQNIIDFSDHHLKKSGWLYLEIHEHYSKQMLLLFNEKKWQTSMQKDYENKPRFVIAQKQ